MSKCLNKILLILLCFYMIIMPIFPSNFTFKSIKVSDGILVIFVCFYLLMLLLSNETRIRFKNGIIDFFTDYFTIFLFLFFILMYFSCIIAINKKISLNETLRYTSYLILFFIIKCEFYEIRAKKYITYLFLILSVATGLIGIYQYFNGIGLVQGTFLRVYSTFENPNNFGAYSVIAIYPFILLSLTEKKILKKIIYIIGTIVMLLSIVLSLSRNCWVVFAVGCIIVALLFSYKILIGIIILGIGSLSIPVVSSRIKDVGSMAQNASRIKIWENCIYMIKQHPLFGIGCGNFKILYNQYQKKFPEQYNWIVRDHPHDIFLKVQLEFGILGSVLFIFLIGLSVLKVKDFYINVKDKYLNAFYTGFFVSLIAFYGLNVVDVFFIAPKVMYCIVILFALVKSDKYKLKRFK